MSKHKSEDKLTEPENPKDSQVNLNLFLIKPLYNYLIFFL